MSYESLVKQWSEKLGVSEKSLMDKLLEIEQELRKTYPNRDPSFYPARAAAVLGAKLASLLKSPAKPYVGVILGYGPRIDINARMAEEAKRIFREDPERAIMEGITDEKGTPLDTRKEIGGRPNPRFGRPLRPVYQRTVIGICKPFKGDVAPKFFHLTCRGPASELTPEIGKTYIFRANLRREEEWRYVMNSSVVTQFKESPKPLFDKPLTEVLANAPPQLKTSVLDLEEWYDKNKADPLRVCIVEGDVLVSRDQPTATGNKIITIGDVMSDIEFSGVPVFVPPWAEAYPVGSRVFVIGRPNLGLDLLTGERTRITINAYSVIPIFVAEVEVSDVLDAKW